MATDQVLNWIGGAVSIQGQATLKLSQPVESFEKDFANGYLLGEILAHYGIISNISSFSKKTNKEAKVQNFYQVEDALRYLKVPFDGKISHQIMNEERGASLRLLYQIKLKLDQYFAHNDTTVTNLKKSLVEQKLKKVQELSTSLPKIHKEFGIDGPTFRAVPLQIVEKQLLKFELAKVNLDQKAQKDAKAEVSMLQSMQQTKRQEAINKLKENKMFIKEWEAEGKEKWRENKEKRANEIQRQLKFEDREVKLYRNQLKKQLELHTEDLMNGVNQFQENLQKLGVEQNISIQEAVKRQEQKRGIPPGQIQNFSYAATMMKIKDTKNNNEFAGKERERRNRKMKVDQRKIQESLDAKRQEEDLIRMLLEQQSQQKDEAYFRWRQEQCEVIQLSNRKIKAEALHAQKQKQNDQLEYQMKQNAIGAEEERKSKIEKEREECQKTRKAQKLLKRNLNIEIASEIVDLILDVGDEAFDLLEMEKAQFGELTDDGYLAKPTWREWLSIFEKGKKVSEQNIVINEEDQSQAQGRKNLDSMSMIEGSIDTKDPKKLLNHLKYQPIYNDFLQYICMTGPLNLRLVAQDQWNSFANILNKDPIMAQRKVDLSILDGIHLPTNRALGKLIDELYNPSQKPDELQQRTFSNLNQAASAATTSQAEFSKKSLQKNEIPAHHSIKLSILGRAYAGKRTQAQMIIDKYGADKIVLFDMHDVIREAVNYADPAQVQKVEVVDPKAKDKKNPQQAAQVVQDIFAGQDTSLYKEIGAKLLKQIKSQSGSADQLPGKDADLVSMVQDDNLLVQLFMQKLKLTFKSQGKTAEAKEAHLRELIQKEKDLLKELEEASSQPAVEVDPKAKGGKAQKAQKGYQEIQEDIKNLMSIEKNGWILLDFPKNLNQAKLLEESFSGYKSVIDQPKSQNFENYEAWTKFADPFQQTKEGYEAEVEVISSLFDIVILLDASKEEILRRAQNRKVDPASGTIYHKQDNPPPEGDLKYLDQLKNYNGIYSSEEEMIQKLSQKSQYFQENESKLKSFYSQFGAYDSQAGKGFETLVEIKLTGQQKKQQTSEQVLAQLNEFLKLKQMAYDQQVMQVKQKMKKEEEQKLIDEAVAAESSQKERLAQADPVQDATDAKSFLPEEAPQLIAHQFDPSHKTLTSHAVMSHSKFSQSGKASKKKNRVEYTREFKIKVLEEMESAYIREGMITLNDIKRQQGKVVTSLNQSQKRFFEFLERPDIKQEKINEFVHSLNKLSFEFPDLRKDEQTKEELMSRLSQLSDSLWDIVEQRKNESVDYITKMSKGGESDIEMRELCRNMANLIEIEIKKFESIYRIVMQAEPPVQLDAEILTKKLIERGVSPYDGHTQLSPIMENVIHNILTKLEDIVFKNPSMQQILQDQQGEIILNEKNIFVYRLALINTFALVNLQEIYVNSHQVYRHLDDQLVGAVAQENRICKSIIAVLREMIGSDQGRTNEYSTQIQTLNLQDSMEPIHFSKEEMPLYLKNVQLPIDELEHTRFNAADLKQLYKEMRYFTGEKGSVKFIDEQSIINIMMLAIRQGRVPLLWKYVNFEKVTSMVTKYKILPLISNHAQDGSSLLQEKLGLSIQNLSQEARSWIDWKKVMTILALQSSPLPSEKELADLRNKMLAQANQDNMSIAREAFQSIEFWFEAYEGKPDKKTEQFLLQERRKNRKNDDDSDYDDEEEVNTNKIVDSDRYRQIINLLFDIHKVHTGEDKLFIGNFINCFQEIIQQQADRCLTFREKIFGKL